MIAVPFLIVIKHEDAIDIQEQYNFRNKDFIYECLLITSCGIAILMMLVYLALFVKYKLKNKLKSQNNKNNYLRMIHQIVITIFIIQQTMLKIPMQMTFVKHIQEIITNGLSTHIYLTVLTLISLVIENILTVIYNSFLTISLPVREIPHTGQALYLQNLKLIISQVLALTYMTPSNLNYTTAIYSVLLLSTTVFVGINIRKLESYNELFQFIKNVQYSMIIATSITFLIKTNKPLDSISLINFLIMILGFSATLQIMKIKFFGRGANKEQKERLTELNYFVTFLLNIGEVQRGASMTQLFGLIAQLKICGIKHFKQCQIEKCECKKDLFYSLFIEQQKHDSDKNDILMKKSTYIQKVQQMTLQLMKSIMDSLDHSNLQKSKYQQYL